MPESPLVSIVIPHHLGQEILRKCLKSTWETDYPRKEVFVVDNDSQDGSVESAIGLYPDTQVVRSRRRFW